METPCQKTARVGASGRVSAGAGEHGGRLHACRAPGSGRHRARRAALRIGRSDRLPRRVARPHHRIRGLVSETPWETIRALDAGARFDARFAGERVPLLEDALSATSLLVNVELKSERRDDRGLTSAVLRAVRRTASASRVLLSSFNPFCLLRARAEEPSLPRALLFEREGGFVLRRALSAPALGVVALHPQDELATERAVARWRRRGYAVSPWTVDDPLRALALHRAGATGIITNVPDRLLEAFASRTSAPSGRR